ncbi:MAG: alpha/beta hydrolase [Dehalococcoidia bacterium]
MAETRRIASSDGVNIAVRVEGHGHALYVLHGGPMNDKGSFGDYLRPLADDYEVCFIDQRGCGESDDAPPETYTIPRLAEDIEDVRLAMGHGRVIVLGHSFGGILAVQYAIQHPAGAAAVVLVDALFRGWRGVMATPSSWLLWLKALRPGKGDSAGLEFHLRYEVANREKVDEIRAMWNRPIRYDEARAGPLMKQGAGSFDINKVIASSIPVVGIYGAQDRRFLGDARALQRAGAPVKFIPNAGHEPFVEQPELFHAALRDLLSGALAEGAHA